MVRCQAIAAILGSVALLQASMPATNLNLQGHETKANSVNQSLISQTNQGCNPYNNPDCGSSSSSYYN